VEPGTPENETVSVAQGGSSPNDTGRAPRCPEHPLRRIIRGFVKRAVLWSLAFCVAHLLGFRAYMSLLSGTAPLGQMERAFGATYLVLYVGFVFLVPVLLIAAGLLKGVELIGGPWPRAGKRSDSSESEAEMSNVAE